MQIKSARQLFQEQFLRELQASQHSAIKTQTAKNSQDAKLFEMILKKAQSMRLQKKV